MYINPLPPVKSTWINISTQILVWISRMVYLLRFVLEFRCFFIVFVVSRLFEGRQQQRYESAKKKMNEKKSPAHYLVFAYIFWSAKNIFIRWILPFLVYICCCCCFFFRLWFRSTKFANRWQKQNSKQMFTKRIWSVEVYSNFEHSGWDRK